MRFRPRRMLKRALELIFLLMLVFTVNLISSVIQWNQMESKRKIKLISDQQCQRNDHIVYIKIHKTGSSTIANLLYRMALKRNIPVLLFTGFPHEKRTFWDAILHTSKLVNESAHNFTWKIVADHMIYEKNLFRNLMPQQTAYVSTLRYPADQLRSMFHYWDSDLSDYLSFKSKEDTVSEFLGNMERFPEVENLPRNLQIRNRHAMLLGLDRNDQFRRNVNQEKILKYLEDFKLMMITEYMDESLVLLRRKMCWDLSDILYLPTNVRSYSFKSKPVEAKLLQNHRNWSSTDYFLYEHYNETLRQKLSQQSEDFWEELKFYKTQQKRIYDFCFPIIEKFKSDLSAVDHIFTFASLDIPPTRWGQSFEIGAIWCILNKLRILAMRNILRVKQYPQLCKYVNNSNISPKMFEFELDETRDILTMHPSFCKEKTSGLDFSLDILRQRTAYLWTN